MGKVYAGKRKYNVASRAASVIQSAWRHRRFIKGAYDAGRRLLSRGNSRRSDATVKVSRSNSLVQYAEKDGIGGSHSKFHYGKYQLRLPRHVLSELCKNYKVINSAAVVSSVVGKQNVFDAAEFFGAADCAAMLTATAGKSIFIGVRSRTLLTNASNTTCFVLIYDIVPKRDLSNGTITAPSTAWSQGVSDEGVASAYQIPGNTPFSSKSFTEWFTIRKVTKITLAQGETHEHEAMWYPNKSMDYGVLQYASILKGLTCFQMIVHHGQCSDAITGGAVSIGASKLNFVTYKEYEHSWIADNTTSLVATNSLPTTFTGGENTISLGAGLVEAYTTA